MREEHKEYLENRKREALDAQSLMEDISQRKKRQEENKTNGLVIVRAIYGNLDNEQQIDVTVVVQTLVHESRLTVPGGHSKVFYLSMFHFSHCNRQIFLDFMILAWERKRNCWLNIDTDIDYIKSL